MLCPGVNLPAHATLGSSPPRAFCLRRKRPRRRWRFACRAGAVAACGWPSPANRARGWLGRREGRNAHGGRSHALDMSGVDWVVLSGCQSGLGALGRTHTPCSRARRGPRRSRLRSASMEALRHGCRIDVGSCGCIAPQLPEKLTMNHSSPFRRRPCETKPVRIIGLGLPIIRLVVAILVGVGLIASQAGAFGEHKTITRDALSFLRYELVEHIVFGNETNDYPGTIGDDEKHCDDCEFDGTSIYINENYSDAMDQLGPDGDFDPWGAAFWFGSLTHPAQDFYSHSNWVELGLIQGDDPSTPEIEVRTADLYDLSGAPYGNLQNWFEPSPSATFVRHGPDGIQILLDHDDMEDVPEGWSVDPNGGGTHVPILRDEKGEVVGKLLVSGESDTDDECDISNGGFFSIFEGFSHAELNKDATTHDLYPKARALAVLQTSYEWCRLVFKAGLEGIDGLLLALWVSPDGSPHPPNTPFAAATNPSPSDPARGLKEITVTVERVQVLHSGDTSDNEPGEVN